MAGFARRQFLVAAAAALAPTGTLAQAVAYVGPPRHIRAHLGKRCAANGLQWTERRRSGVGASSLAQGTRR